MIAQFIDVLKEVRSHRPTVAAPTPQAALTVPATTGPDAP
jgi:hypothetical protein